ncbi:MAG: sigma-70 family RNA polymerase sigma factor [Acidimicrobiia bacterium]|nr:sigma-70 family RNA polymerase sigma factor [Acidimicrobiia bacterium]
MITKRSTNPPPGSTFDDFFRDQQQRVLQLCWLSTLDRAAAADAAQEAFARAYTRWGTISEGNPGAWIRTVALNLCRDRWRKESRLSDRALPESSAGDRYQNTDLLSALELLSGRQREVIVLRYWMDLKLDDCAKAMNVSTSSARQHLSRAHDRLRDLVGPEIAKDLVS